MVKMIMELPAHIDVDNYLEIVLDVIKGRFGRSYSGLIVQAKTILWPEKISAAYAKGYSGKNGVKYYEIDAEELDPVIIATLEEVGKMVGFDYAFVDGKNILAKDWWRANTSEGFHKHESAETDSARENYESILYQNSKP